MGHKPGHHREIWNIVQYVAVAAFATSCMLGFAAVLTACEAQRTASVVSNPNPWSSGSARASTSQRSWQRQWAHDKQVIANLKARPPATPVVLVLGGSAVRECTISDETWAAQVQALGRTAATYNLGSSNRTFGEDLALIQALPPNGLDGIAFLGVNLGSFSRSETSASITLPTPTFPLPPWHQHIVSQAHILSVRAKRVLVKNVRRQWVTARISGFNAHYSAQSALLERLITACESRHLHPILILAPLNMAVIGHAVDGPISRVRRTCRALSAKYSIPFVGGLADAARLTNSDFYDTYHLVEPGRVKWQRLLSRETALQLRSHGLGLAASGAAQ